MIFNIREEYTQRIEQLLNEKESFQSKISSLSRDKELFLKERQQHIKEFETQ